MSPLTEALDRIFACLEQHYPEFASSLQPGLTFEEIEDKTKDLPFRLPREVYEIYQWKNGAKKRIFHKMYFYSLETALQVYPGLSECLSYQPIQGFPVFGAEDDEYPFVVCDGEETSSVLSIGDGKTIFVVASSITNMMLTIAES